MRFSRSTRLAAAAFAVAVISLAVAGCDDEASPTTPAPSAPAPAPPPAPPPEPEPAPIQAGEVVDRETLKSFVEAAAHEVSTNVADGDELYAFLDATFGPEGRWRHEDIYLFVHHRDGTGFFHPLDKSLEGQDLLPLEDVNGVKISEEILAAVAAGGDYVEYRWPNPEVDGDEETGSPKVGYALPLDIGDLELLIGSGIYAPVKASDVLNRGNLQQFVERAAAALSEHAADRESAHAFLDANFRDEGEWRHLDIYVFVITMEGINFFQAPDPDWEGTDVSDSVDLNGVRLGQGLLEAARAGGGFVAYSWDNPVVEGDEEHGSPKLAYAVPITVGEEPMLLGSGIYLDASEQ